MQNWELQHIRKPKTNWLSYCRWTFRSLQKSVWSYGSFLPILSRQETRLFVRDEDFERGNKRRQMDDLRWSKFSQKRGAKSERCGILSGGKTSNRSKKLRIISDPIFPKNDLSLLNLHRKKKEGFLYGYIHCEIVVLDKLKAKFSLWVARRCRQTREQRITSKRNFFSLNFEDYQNLKWSGLEEQRALKKNQIKTVPASEWDMYKYLQEIWQKNGMICVKVFCIGTTTKVLFQPLKQRKKCSV